MEQLVRIFIFRGEQFFFIVAETVHLFLKCDAGESYLIGIRSSNTFYEITECLHERFG